MASSAISSSQNMRASSRAECPSQERTAAGSTAARRALDIGFAMRQHAFGHAAAQIWRRLRAYRHIRFSWLTSSATRNAANVRFPAGPRVATAPAGWHPPRSMQQRRDPRLRQAGQFRQRMGRTVRDCPDNNARRISPAVSWPVARRCRTRPLMSSPRERAAILTVERSRASLRDSACPIWRSASLRATTNWGRYPTVLLPARPRGGGKILQHQHRSRIAARWPVALDDAVP